MKSQQDNWELIPKSKRREGGPAFVRVVALENLRAMCARLSVGDQKFEIMHVAPTGVMVGARKGESVAVGIFPAKKATFPHGNEDNPCVFLDVRRSGDCKKEESRALFEPLVTCPSLWRDPARQLFWETHAEGRAMSKRTALIEGRVYCSICLSKGETRIVKADGSGHDSNDAWLLDANHVATPGTKWHDTCTFCDCEGGNSGPPPDPNAPKPPPVPLEGQDPASPIHPEALQQMRDGGGTWFAYQNEDLSSGNCGHLQYLKCGEGCTCASPPEKMPDSRAGLGWRYLYLGPVDTATGLIQNVREKKS